MEKLWQELKRRNVFKVGVAYAITAWLLLQLLDILLPTFNAPAWVMQVFVLLLGVGFVIALFVAWAFELTPEGIKRTEDVEAAASIAPRTGQRLNVLIISALSLLVVLLVLDNYLLSDRGSVVDSANASTVNLSPAPDAPATVEASARSVAVLPFANLSDDKEQEYFSDGLSEEILNKLSQVNDLQVAARTSSFFYKDRNEDMRTIGERLGVNYLLEGSVRKGGESLRITAKLIQADNGFELWSGTFDRQLTDVFAIQDEIAKAVTTALRVTLGTDEFALPGSTRNVEAYQLYLQGMALLNRGGDSNENVYQSIEEQLRQAVILDPEYARAWLALGQIYDWLSIVAAQPERRADNAVKRDDAFGKAAALAPTMAELQLQRESQVKNLVEREAGLRRLLELKGPIEAEVNLAYATFLADVGRTREALPFAEQANRLNPMDLDVHNALGGLLLTLNRPADAQAVVDRANAFVGDGAGGFLPALDWSIANATGGTAAWAEKAFAYYETRSNQAAADFNLAAARRMVAEDKAAAVAELRAFALNPDSALALRTISAFHANMMGEPELALEIMMQTGRTLNLWSSPASDMRQLPGFKDLLRQQGIVDYWRATGNWGDYCRPLAGNDDFECYR